MQQIEDSLSKFKGKPITCQLCNHKFSMITPEQKDQWKESNFTCPNCGEDYVILPKTERVLRRLQDKYFKENRNDKYLSEMYKILIPYAQSLLKKHFSNRLHDREDALYYYSHTASQLLIIRYLQKEDFLISVSFGQFLIKKIYEAIFSKFEHTLFKEIEIGKNKDGSKKKIKMDSLNYEFEDGNIIEYADSNKSIIEKIEEQEDKKTLWLTICQFIFELEKKCCSKSENYTRLLAIDHYLDNGEFWTDKLFEEYGREGKEKFKETMNLLKNFLIENSDIENNYRKNKNIIKDQNQDKSNLLIRR